MQQFKMYDGLKCQTRKMAQTIAKKHNFIRRVYLVAIILGSVVGMQVAILELAPVVSHFFFAGFLALYCSTIEVF